MILLSVAGARESVTAAPRCSAGSLAARMLTRANTPFAPRPGSRPPPYALDWLNKGIFISVAGRTSGSVIYETYLVA